MERLQKVIAASGVASRRKAEGTGKAPGRNPPRPPKKQRTCGSFGGVHQRGQVQPAERPLRRADF